MELSKSQKKIARILIDEAMQRECQLFLESIRNLLNKTAEGETPHSKYLKLYKKVDSFDNHLAQQYDRLRGSRYLLTVVALFNDNILTEEDIAKFDEITQIEIFKLKNTLFS